MNLYYAKFDFGANLGEGRCSEYFFYARSKKRAKQFIMVLAASMYGPDENISLAKLERIVPYEGMVIG